MSWITQKICEFIEDCLSGVSTAFGGFVTNLFTNRAQEIISSSQVCAMTITMMGLATVCVAFMVCKQLFTVYILETDGDPESDPLSFLVKAAVSLAMIWSTSIVLEWVMSLSGQLSEEIMNSVGYQSYTSEGLVSDGLNAVAAILFSVVYVIGVILVAFKAAFRAVELGVMKVLYPVFCIDIITVSQERWKTFFQSYLVLAFGFIIQLVCFEFALIYGMGSLENCLIALAFLFFAVKSPSWIEKFAYASGAGRSTAGAIRSGMSLMQTIRMMKLYR